MFAVAFAALFVAAFPPMNVWPAAMVAIMPLVWMALAAERSARSSFVVWVVSFGMWLFLERWMLGVTAVGWPLTAAYLAIYPALFVWIGARLARRAPSSPRLAVALAVVWIGLETLRGEIAFTGYAWFLIAQPLLDTPIAQLAEWLGVYGVGFLVATPQTLIAVSMLRKRRVGATGVMPAWAPVSEAAIILIIAFVIGALIRPGRQDGDRATVAVVQTNVPQNNKINWSLEQRIADFDRMRELTREAVALRVPGAGDDDSDLAATGEKKAPDLIIWPETMFPGETLSPEATEEVERAGLVYPGGLPVGAFYNATLEFQNEIGAPMLIGAIGYDHLRVTVGETGDVAFDHEGKYNSAFLVRGGAVETDRYDKLHLTPFGEVMPYISWSDRLERMLLSLGAPGMAFDLDVGKGPTVFQTPLRSRDGQNDRPSGADAAPTPANRSLRTVTPICFEAATPSICRRLVFRAGVRQADLMVNMTNDGWFGDTVGGREQHLQVARWRTIELRTPMVRAANTGVSAFIDNAGRIQSAGVMGRKEWVNVDGVLIGEVELPTRGTTLYARTGDLAGFLSMGGLLWFGWAASKTRPARCGGGRMRIETVSGLDSARKPGRQGAAE